MGIDLGTTNSVMALMEGDKPIIIPNNLGERLTSSVVGFTEDGEILVGKRAKKAAALQIDRTVFSIKRHMGTNFRVRINGKEYTPQEISSMIVQKSSFIEELAQFAPDLEYGVAPFPLPEGGKPAVMFGAVWIGIPASAEHPEEAWEFIKYYTQASVQKRIADFLEEQKLVGFFPANIEAAGTPARLAKPGMAVFLESMQWAHTPTVIPLAHAVFWREYGNAWDEAVRGLKPARVALAKAEKIIQDALDDQLEYDEFYRNYLREREEAQERNRMAQGPDSEETRTEIAGREGGQR